ncbi:MAG: hypothetical protein VX438_03185, partial [Planctomycetota bacterium]|nr:hypothetical protein [Planctomycetota bacterium]
KDQFATYPKSPSLSFTPTGANPNTMTASGTNNSIKPANSPWENKGVTGSSTPSRNHLNNHQTLSKNPPSQNTLGTRSPYNGKMPGTLKSSTFGTSNQLQQPVARTASNSNFATPASGVGNFSASNTVQSGTSLQPTGTAMGTTTPSSQFRNQPSAFPSKPSAFPSSPGTYTPNTTAQPPLNPNSPAGDLKTTQPINRPATTKYPTTQYPGFGSSSKSSGTTAQPIQKFQSKNVTASANMTPASSLPGNVFDKKGGYAPGSTGTSVKATQAGFETNSSLQAPPNGSKIPSTTEFYSPN